MTFVGPTRPTSERSNTRRLVVSCFRPGTRTASALSAAILSAVVIPLFAPQLTRQFVDRAIAGAKTSSLVAIAIEYLIVTIVGQISRILTAWLASRTAWNGTNRLREVLAGHALSLDTANHSGRTTGEMIERVDGDVLALGKFVVSFLLEVVAGLLTLVGVLVIMLTVDFRIGGIMTLLCVLLGIGMVRLQRVAVPATVAARQQSALLFGDLEERLAGVEDIRSNGGGLHILRRFHESSARYHSADYRADRLGRSLYAVTSCAFAIATAIVLAFSAWITHSDASSVGTSVLLFQYTQMLRTPLDQLLRQLQPYQKSLASVTRIVAFLSERPTLEEPRRPHAIPLSGPLSVEIDNVTFTYPNTTECAISGVSICVSPGETLGLVGRTGSGKSTIARLVLRLYDASTGTIRVGGVDVRDVATRSLRERICLVTQEVQLFSASVRDNLTLFERDIDDDRLCVTLDDVGLGDWLDALPHGLDTMLVPTGTGTGTGTSAGEAQLLAFARALLTDAGLVVLDEPSSRVDPATESKIDLAMSRLLTDRTGILIAHRLTSLKRADKIAVIDNGCVAEYGSRAGLSAEPDSRFGRLLDASGIPR